MNSHLNGELGIPSRVWFGQGPGGLMQAHLAFGEATASLFLQGAHLCSYKPDGQTEQLWVSNTSHYEQSKPIRGGVPVCWPWFGAHTDSAAQPQHGFARNSAFEVLATHANEHHTSISLRLKMSETCSALAPDLTLEFSLQLAASLSMELLTFNNGSDTVPVGAALHTYFRVAKANVICIDEVTGLAYKDKTKAFSQFTQSDDLVVKGEIDRVYLDPPARVSLKDPGRQQCVSVSAWGNTDLVVWNPGPDVASAMPDFDNDGYTSMVCIEPAIALDNIIHLAPGERHALGQTLHVEPYRA